MGSPKIWWVFFSWKIYENLTKMDDFKDHSTHPFEGSQTPGHHGQPQQLAARQPGGGFNMFQQRFWCFTDVLRMFYGFFTDVFRIFNLWIYLWMFVDVYRCLWMHMVHGLWWWCCCCCSSADLPNVRIWRARSVRWSWATCRQDGNELGMDQPMTIWLIWLGE